MASYDFIEIIIKNRLLKKQSLDSYKDIKTDFAKIHWIGMDTLTVCQPTILETIWILILDNGIWVGNLCPVGRLWHASEFYAVCGSTTNKNSRIIEYFSIIDIIKFRLFTNFAVCFSFLSFNIHLGTDIFIFVTNQEIGIC